MRFGDSVSDTCRVQLAQALARLQADLDFWREYTPAFQLPDYS